MIVLLTVLILHFPSKKFHVEFLEGSTERRAGKIINDGIEHTVKVGKANSSVKSHICITEKVALGMPALQHPHCDTRDVAWEETNNENQSNC